MRTQRETILQALRDAGDRGLCISDLADVDWTVVLTARNRVSDLRKEGLHIDGAPCKQHRHRGSVFRYRWWPDPEQLSLL